MNKRVEEIRKIPVMKKNKNYLQYSVIKNQDLLKTKKKVDD